MKKNLILSLCAALLAMIAVHGIALAQPPEGCREITLADGTKVTCVIVNGQKVYADADGNVYNLNSTGNATFEATGNKGCVQVLAPLSLSASGSDPVLGVVTTTLDASRTPSPSTVAQTIDAGSFPAAAAINFYAYATLSSKPGVTYRSVTELSLTGVVNTFNPFNQEKFSISSPVDFEDVKAPGKVAFTLKDLSVTLN